LYLFRCRRGRPPEYVIIRVSSDSDLTYEDQEEELERAFEEEAEVIVIEPQALGDETMRWISLGNFLHKLGVVAGLGCITVPFVTKSNVAPLTLGAISVTCASIYSLSWQNDPMCKYQKTVDLSDINHVVESLNCLNPVVLIRRDDCRRKKLHNCFAFVSGIICAYKLYSLYKAS